MKLFQLFFFLVLVAACGNPCDDLDCGPNGTCSEELEACVCDEYYEGTNCESEVRAKFLGTWSGTRVCDFNSNVSELDVNITQDVSVETVLIQSTSILQNFAMSGRLNADNDIFIPEFQSNIGANTQFGKVVFIDANNIEMTLNVNVNGELNTCVYTLSK